MKTSVALTLALLLGLVSIAHAQIDHALLEAAVTENVRVVHLSTYLFENPYTDVQASDLSDGRTAVWVSVLDRDSGAFLSEWTAWLGPDDLIVNPQGTAATLRFRGVDLTWTATWQQTVKTSSSYATEVIRPSGTTFSKHADHSTANDALVKGVVDGRVVDTTAMPFTATITRSSGRSVTR